MHNTPLLIGVNLKMYMDMHQTTQWLGAAVTGLKSIESSPMEIFVLPSAPVISLAISLVTDSDIQIGAQNASEHAAGAYTGEYSAHLLNELGCKYLLIGHHERRTLFAENELVINHKVHQALGNSLTPVLCVGEKTKNDTLKAKSEISQELQSALAGLSNEELSKPMIIAYEPTWAIGAPSPAGSEHINEICRFIREELALIGHHNFKVMYGGSAGSGVYQDIAETCDGLFLGRRAHDPVAFLAIVEECLSVR
jgi:triosephosphate isomerase